MKKINIGLIGYGYWGPNLARIIEESDSAEFVYCADLLQGSLDTVSKKYPHVRTTKDYKTILKDPKIDAVFVVTPAKTHYMIVKDILNAGKHVFVEKPLATTSEQAQELADLALKKKKTLLVGHVFLYNPAVNYIKDAIKKGSLGNLRHLHFQRRNLGKIYSDVNVMWDLAPHDISMLLYFVKQKPIEVLATGRSYIHKGITDVVSAMISFEEGIIANFIFSRIDPVKIRDITIVGDKKMLLFDDVSSTEKIKIFDKNVNLIRKKSEGTYSEFQLALHSGDIFLPAIENKEPLKIEFDHFIDCVQTGKQPRTNGQNGVNVVRIMEALQQSLDTNSSVQRLT